MGEYTTLIAVIAGIIVLFVFLYFVPVNLWITAQFFECPYWTFRTSLYED